MKFRIIFSLVSCLALAACGGSSTTPGPEADAAPGDDGAVADANPNGGPDGAVADANPNAPDATQPDAQVGVACGPSFCDPGTQKCCVTGGQNGTTSTCIASADTCQGASLACDGPEDCPTTGDVCCGTLAGGGHSACQSAASCHGALLCGAATDCPQSKPNCCANDVLGVSICQADACM